MAAVYLAASGNSSFSPTMALASPDRTSTIAPLALEFVRIPPMLFAYLQQLDPLASTGIFWSPFWSALLAGLPVLVLFWLLVPARWLAPTAGLAGAVTAIIVAIVVYG